MKLKNVLSLLLLVVLLLPSLAIQAQGPDTDGDTVPDEFDSCPAEVGLPQNGGCVAGTKPDIDADGVPDSTDLCYRDPGDPAFLGCTEQTFPNTDADGDGVVDPLDSCYAQPGADINGGCPEGTSPDYDGDGVADGEDACPREFGDLDNGGCVRDTDGDVLADAYDGCPNEVGTADNYGCPAGALPPDTDGDTLPDLGDSCPNEVGALETSGCPDTDLDLFPDVYDSCPNEGGLPELNGCPSITTAVLPASRAPINTANAAQITELARLVVGAYQASLTPGSAIALQTPSSVLVYNLAAPELNPQPLESTGGTVVFSPASNKLAMLRLTDGFSAPTLEIWDAASATMQLTIPQENQNVNSLALSPDGAVLATAHGSYYSPDGVETPDNNVRLWNTATGELIAALPHNLSVYRVLFSPTGTLLVSQTDESTLHIWDIASQTELGTLTGTFSPFFLGESIKFSADGSRLVTGGMDGSLTIWDVASRTAIGTFPVFNAANQEMVSAVAFSPDGTLILAAGGAPFTDGGSTGTEQYVVSVLDAATGQVLHTLSGHVGTIVNVDFTPDSTLIITVGDTSVRFWGIAQ